MILIKKLSVHVKTRMMSKVLQQSSNDVGQLYYPDRKYFLTTWPGLLSKYQNVKCKLFIILEKLAGEYL